MRRRGLEVRVLPSTTNESIEGVIQDTGARRGLGVALVPRFFVLKELRQGELVVPCELPLSSAKGYYLVYPEAKEGYAPLKAFEEWLLASAAEYREGAE